MRPCTARFPTRPRYHDLQARGYVTTARRNSHIPNKQVSMSPIAFRFLGMCRKSACITKRSNHPVIECCSDCLQRPRPPTIRGLLLSPLLMAYRKPYPKCTGIIALVFVVIAGSINLTSIFWSGPTSTKTGLRPFGQSGTRCEMTIRNCNNFIPMPYIEHF